MSIAVLLLVAAFICCILSALGKCPEWVALLLTIVAVFLQVYH